MIISARQRLQQKGKLNFSQGIDFLEQPLSATINWNGKRLDVLRAKGDGLDAQGYVVLDPSFFNDIPDKLAAVNYFQFDVLKLVGLILESCGYPYQVGRQTSIMLGEGFCGKN